MTTHDAAPGSTDPPMAADLSKTHWTTQDRARHFIIPDDAELAPGELALRTATGRERSVEESAVAPFEVTEEEARAWAKEQLGAVFGELRGQTLDFVQKLRQKTAEMREENRRTWEQAVADAPPEVREAGSQLRDMLKDLGATLRRAAREHGYDPDAADSADAAPSATSSTSAASVEAADSVRPTGSTAGANADFATSATPSASADADLAQPAESTRAADADAAQPAESTRAVDADAGQPAESTMVGGNAAPRVDAPAIRLRPEP